ncbi:MAG: bifunctional UDP-N-acetylglucosamine diphosphorylase/glucosamine-1-phosphate N-acetyltransferase GlmU [Coriobacteriia bacterium]|nr:bifunctional UDP-N-acetylglucosamine diphosphorylase/glucosamine-1-phosphate N-acetyltransferase GlmU [Coriobacteriia bacterium]
MSFSTLIMAAGEGKRMHSKQAKVCHELLGRPLIRWIINAAQAAGSEQVITVVGQGREQVAPLVEDTVVVVQEEPLGTGHAVMSARGELERLAAAGAGGAGAGAAGAAVAGGAGAGGAGAAGAAVAGGAGGGGAVAGAAVPTASVAATLPDAPPFSPLSSLVVLNGDTPLISPQTIAALVQTQQQQAAAVCLLAHNADDPGGYGRVIVDDQGGFLRVVEDKDASPDEKCVRLCNSGAYCFDLPLLLASLEHLNNNNAQHEYYLTQVLELFVQGGQRVAVQVVDEAEAQGVNDRKQLAEATRTMQGRINDAWMLAGVTMLDPRAVWIGPDVELEQDVELLPQTLLSGRTQVGRGSVIGPNTRITDSRIGRDCLVDESILISCELEDQVKCGPRAFLRAGTLLKNGAKAGTHVEIKNSTIGAGSKVPHLSYLGDATVGRDVNIGAGTITCNYDGQEKNPTIIGDRAFIGSNTMFVAPVQVGADTVTGAGSTITRNVPDGALGLERSEQKTIMDWAEKHRKGKQGQRDGE